MRIGGLYLKMLIAFVLVQVLAMLTMVTLVKTGAIRPPFLYHAEKRVEAVKEFVSQELAGETSITPQARTRLDAMLRVFSSAFNGQTWLTTPDGSVVSSSGVSPSPLSGDETIDKEEHAGDGSTLYLLKRDRHHNIYVVGTIPFRDTTLTIHILHQWKKQKEERWFLEGLLLMSSIAALLLIPVSRRLTRPIKELSRAAGQVADGDFSPRVDFRHRGELSVLADSFNRMAENVERMVRGGQELTANLSHELRSPLARIRLSQQIIQERLESGRSDGIEKHIEKMEAEIEHMDALIDRILKLSKLDLQEPLAREDMVTVNELVQEAVRRHQPLIEDKGMKATVMASETAPLRCNRESMVMVMDNILSNAIKYGPNGGAIDITTEADGDSAVITVTNPYLPVSPEELESIFVPFKRLGYDEVEGNGLGLAFARKIVTDHGGTIEAESVSGQFRIRLQLPCPAL